MYLDTANLTEIKAAYETNLFLGVTTNPTILWKEKQPRFDILKQIDALDVGELFCQVIGEDLEDRYEDYLRIKAFEDNIETPLIIKIAVDRIGLQLIKRIKEHTPHQRILATAIYSRVEGILATIAGCDYLAPYVNRMEMNGIDSYAEIKAMRAFIDDRHLDTQIIAASFKQVEQVTKAFEAGAHTATVSYAIFEAMTSNVLVDEAVGVFQNHSSEYPDID